MMAEQMYKPTHYSMYDGSLAMMVSEDPFILENEDGFRWDAKPEEWPSLTEVSDQKLSTINLLRNTSNGTWFNANLGWVGDITLASIVSDRAIEILSEETPDPDHWEVVRFVELPW